MSFIRGKDVKTKIDTFNLVPRFRRAVRTGESGELKAKEKSTKARKNRIFPLCSSKLIVNARTRCRNKKNTFFIREIDVRSRLRRNCYYYCSQGASLKSFRYVLAPTVYYFFNH